MLFGMAGRKEFLLFYYISLLFFLFLLVSCHVVRSVYWNVTDLNDYKKFPADSLKRPEQPWSFYECQEPIQENFHEAAGCAKDSTSFDNFLQENGTVAFLIIRNDTILSERYYKGYSRASILPSFSIAKSFVSALVGVAIEDGYIQSLDQSIMDFLPELSDPEMKKVTIKNLLEMRSGLNYQEGYLNPFGEVAKFYYGLNLRRYTTNLKTAGEPGLAYQYQSANTQLLAMAIESATGKPLSQYFQEKIWSLLGPEYDASWSIDSKRDHEVKAFCCFNARITDFAKFGRLFLNEGNWNGHQVVQSSWINESLTISNDSRDADGIPYTYGWRVTLSGDFFAKGVGRQYIYACPHRHLLILRFGSKYGNASWVELMEKISHSL